MLATPDTSLGPAGRPTPRRIELLTDWVELWGILEKVEIYKENVADVILECYFATDQDDAHSIVAQIWRSLTRRKRNIGAGYPFEVTNDYLIALDTDEVAYSFMLVLSAPEYLSGYSIDPSDGIRNDFEKFTVQGIRSMLPNWDVEWCGATSADMKAAGGIIAYVANMLSTQQKDSSCFSTNQDGGVDFLAIWKSIDGRAAKPALWGQCATGLNWKGKVREPDFKLWADAIRLVPDGLRALAIPFVLDQTTFTKTSVRGGGWIVDRERLAKHINTINCPDLASRIGDWVERQIPQLS